jgi:hypothetical protein
MNQDVCGICGLPGHWTRNCPGIPLRPEDRYAIGRDGVFATLYDQQEKRLIVDNATAEHCARVRDQLLAAGGEER